MNIGNLGAAVGGAVQGYQAQQRLNMAEQEQASNQQFQERRMRIAEADEAEKAAARQREQQMRDASAALFKKYYGERTEQVGETVGDDGNGGQAKIPTMKTTMVQPGMDAETDGKWAVEHALLAAKHSGMGVAEMKQIADMVDTGRRTTAGKALDKILAGDSAAMSTFLKHIGKDPEGAKLDRRPVDGVNQIVLASGETVDLKRAAAATATAAYYKQLMDEEHAAQTTARNKAVTEDTVQQGNLRREEAAMLPKKGKLLDAQTAVAGAQAGLIAAKTKNVGIANAAAADEKVNKQALAEINAVLERDPSSMDGKGKNMDMAAFLHGRAVELRTAGKMNAAQSVAAARREWDAVAVPAAQWAKGLSSMSPKDRKAKYGSADIETIKNEAIKRTLMGSRPVPAAATRQSNIAIDDSED